uniref:Uncharacterized protein n=1 Tax=Tanacetum cinerariifolium TaxID=118510 RepID=A0A6L2NW24_TANCI|nr:hypothetical protein [Tanacetum cinerariifolium]
MDLDFAADGNLRELNGEEAWETIENFIQGQKEYDNPPNIISKQSLSHDRFNNNVSFEEELVHQRLRNTLTHVLELSSCIYLDDRVMRSQIFDNSTKGLGYESYHAVPPPPIGFIHLQTDLSYYGQEEFQQPEFESYRPKSCKIESKNTSKNIPNELKESIKVKESSDVPLVKKLMSYDKFNKVTTARPKAVVSAVKRNPVNTVLGNKDTKPYTRLRKFKIYLSSSGLEEFKQPKFESYGPKASKSVCVDTSNVIKKVFDAPIIKDWVSNCDEDKSDEMILKSEHKREQVNQARKENQNPMNKRTNWNEMRTQKLGMVLKHALKTVEKETGQREVRPVWNNAMRVNHQNFSNYRRNFAPSAVLTKSGIVPISTDRQSSLRAAAPGDPQAPLRDTRIFDNGCSRHMTKNKSFLSDYQEYDGGFIAFAGSSKRVTILNTLDRLGKFDGKADEGFLVGYYIKNKAFRVYNSRTKKVKKNLHVNFFENKPNVIRSGLEWLFDIDSLTISMNYQSVSVRNRNNGIAGLKIHSDAGQEEKEKVCDQEYILLPVLNTSSDVSSSNEEVVSSPKDDAGRKSPVEPTYVDDLVCLDQQMKSTYDFENTNSFITDSPTVNTASDKDGTFQRTYGKWNLLTPITVNAVGSSFSYPAALDDFSKMPNLEDTGIFDDAYDDRDEGAEADYNNLETALDDESRVEAMQEELLQFKLLNVWRLVDLPHGKIAIRTKWVYRNKRDQRGIFDFAPIARIEAIRLFLAYASFMDFTVYQMDVKSEFLYDTIEEEVYVSQPPGFVDPTFPAKVYKVKKALFGLHQAFRAWFGTLSTNLLENRFRRGQIDKTLFIKKIKDDILLVQVSVDDIIFGSTKRSLSIKFEQLMHNRFQMSSMGELTIFLGLQVEQRKDGIFLSQEKYVCDILKKFGFSSVKSVMKRIFRYLKGYPTLGLWYPKNSPLELIAYLDSDYAGASLDRKSITGGCQFLGSRLISWQCKKKTIMANSTIEAEYIAASNCCGQVLWLQNQLLDYGYNFMQTKIHVDNESSICVVKNLVYYSKTKHIEIMHHFIRDSYEKRLIEIVKIHTDSNVADLLTKAFNVTSINVNAVRFSYCCLLGIELKGYLLNDGYADLVQHAGDIVNATGVYVLDFINTTNGHQFTMSNIQERIGYSRANENYGKEKCSFSRNVTPLLNTMLVQHQAPEGEDIVPTPHDSPLIRGYTPGSDEGRITLAELIKTYATLSKRVTQLENELLTTKAIYNKAFITLTNRVKKLESQLKQKVQSFIPQMKKDKETAEHSRDDDDETLAETLLNIKRSSAKDKGK